MTRITVILAAHDANVAGGLGEVTWLGDRECEIRTERAAELRARLERSEMAEIEAEEIE